MAKTIEEYISERDIKFLCHFTRVNNLGSILRQGLIPRSELSQEDCNDFNDEYRHDNTSAVCLSIAFPNYKMFWSIRQRNEGVDWAVLAIKPQVLWKLPCAFCVTNAASTCVTDIPLSQRRDLLALQEMYADWDDERTREKLSIPSHYPTNPQAEVLMLNGVPKKYILGAIVESQVTQKNLKNQHPQLDVKVYPEYFRYRQDYAFW